VKPNYPMSKKTKIQFWIVTLFDPTAEMEYEQYESTSTHYVRTEKEAKKLLIDHTIEYMPKQANPRLDAEWKLYNQWTPFDPQTGKANKKPKQPEPYTTLPLFEFKQRESNGNLLKDNYATFLNELSQTIGYDNLDMNYNDGTWSQDEPFGIMALHTIE
jgi:hypothetical protein